MVDPVRCLHHVNPEDIQPISDAEATAHQTQIWPNWAMVGKRQIAISASGQKADDLARDIKSAMPLRHI
ncbi:hypothetical protein N7508_009704 [Penicillium antarcticum]|uniref:uncharacterized protein n=1 Tax=Penicillium antarcticum TaxID=416450 RepID=UPI0023866390|nr:uncharacterized protein N7508_009704 [Penicillium antarcticum]KAJ5294883.1 hypothetical protein N7508_009704 [Penicillium antarcticum]